MGVGCALQAIRPGARSPINTIMCARVDEQLETVFKVNDSTLCPSPNKYLSESGQV